MAMAAALLYTHRSLQAKIYGLGRVLPRTWSDRVASRGGGQFRRGWVCVSVSLTWPHRRNPAAPTGHDNNVTLPRCFEMLCRVLESAGQHSSMSKTLHAGRLEHSTCGPDVLVHATDAILLRLFLSVFPICILHLAKNSCLKDLPTYRIHHSIRAKELGPRMTQYGNRRELHANRFGRTQSRVRLG
ncbi:uncharacterized protein CC84DRAFT_886264 [Paraphaeosphaeria sporulosa]|uniref:Uncharacterized protein n=1 Tax=Paraphaeosphaeria sporulosa TaxID=1460663 RepID=A0A177CBB2_9PLEO|nr:uncharacterized protein CC84DRAFT_886264 [Paraphaeosphaeria sporulosa]OAG04067.1 hypothetical protein CC84DRAFT_886264 [Paraphaeosphaeria sporulosa]